MLWALPCCALSSSHPVVCCAVLHYAQASAASDAAAAAAAVTSVQQRQGEAASLQAEVVQLRRELAQRDAAMSVAEEAACRAATNSAKEVNI